MFKQNIYIKNKFVFFLKICVYFLFLKQNYCMSLEDLEFHRSGQFKVFLFFMNNHCMEKNCVKIKKE